MTLYNFSSGINTSFTSQLNDNFSLFYSTDSDIFNYKNTFIQDNENYISSNPTNMFTILTNNSLTYSNNTGVIVKGNELVSTTTTVSLETLKWMLPESASNFGCRFYYNICKSYDEFVGTTLSSSLWSSTVSTTDTTHVVISHNNRLNISVNQNNNGTTYYGYVTSVTPLYNLGTINITGSSYISSPGGGANSPKHYVYLTGLTDTTVASISALSDGSLTKRYSFFNLSISMLDSSTAYYSMDERYYNRTNSTVQDKQMRTLTCGYLSSSNLSSTSKIKIYSTCGQESSSSTGNISITSVRYQDLNPSILTTGVSVGSTDYGTSFINSTDSGTYVRGKLSGTLSSGETCVVTGYSLFKV